MKDLKPQNVTINVDDLVYIDDYRPEGMKDDTDDEIFEQFEHMIDEAIICEGLSFFNISYNPQLHQLIIPKGFDHVRATNIVNCYLEIVENDGEQWNHEEEIQYQARLYDAHTFKHRGADDGTFDYAGSYMLEIFDMISFCKHKYDDWTILCDLIDEILQTDDREQTGPQDIKMILDNPGRDQTLTIVFAAERHLHELMEIAQKIIDDHEYWGWIDLDAVEWEILVSEQNRDGKASIKINCCDWLS